MEGKWVVVAEHTVLVERAGHAQVNHDVLMRAHTTSRTSLFAQSMAAFGVKNVSFAHSPKIDVTRDASCLVSAASAPFLQD